MRADATLAVTWSTRADTPRQPAYLSVPQAAAVLRGVYPERTLRRRVRKGIIKAHQGNGYAGTWLIPRMEVLRLAAELQVTPDWAALKR